jgi:tetratricopeptide (TPR) repeat protein
MRFRRSLLVAAPWFLLGLVAAPVVAQTDSADDDRQRQVMERFLGLLEKAPRRGTALDRVYGYHVERGTLDEFLRSYRDRAAKDPKDATAWLLLGLFESQRGRDAAAVEALRKAEALAADDPLPSYYLGQALVLVGRPEEAAEAFERALARKPARSDLLEIYQALGRVHQRAQRNDKALEVWRRLERLMPDDLRVQEQVATALAEEGQGGEALPRFEALARKVGDPYRKVRLRTEAAELKVRLGRVDEALGDLESVLGGLEPESWLHREVRRKVEEVFLRNDDQAGLAKYYERWIARNPDDVDALARLGRSLALQGRSAEARRWLDKAVALAPSRRELRLALVDQLVREGKVGEAAAQYEALAKVEHNNPDTLREWGRLLLRDQSRPEAQRKAEAAKVWRRLAEARPKDPVVAAQVADLFRQAEMPEEAIAFYKKAIELAPGAPQYREYLGEYYHNLKRPDEALAAWGEIAAGPHRDAKALARLAEVLDGFGYLARSLEPSAEACKLDDDDFNLRLKYADRLHRAGRYDDALAQLDVAARLAEKEEESEAVLAAQLQAYEASGTLAAQATSLQKELDSGRDATPARWVRLARLREAEQKLPEALAAARKAVATDARSVPAWTVLARVYEASGDLASAADAQRTLARLDRRSRTEYLTAVARLESRLGRRAQAMQAGRDLLAEAPGNPDHYQFFADLCFGLGEVEEGLGVLRRAVRVNPGDPKALRTLAEALAGQFRTDEAVEMFWRALAKAPDLDGKLAIVSRLTELYLQQNQFDRLVARLRREQGDDAVAAAGGGAAAGNRRDLSICLAQAYQTSGDFGAARAELERPLASNPRDTQLLERLSLLAEAEGDVAAAAKFQQQLVDLAPGGEATARLAQLYVEAGEAERAESIWEAMTVGDHDPHSILQALDSLLGHGKPEAVLTITERLRRRRPDDWELLYREGSALAARGRTAEAAERFRALADLRTADDALSALVKARRKGAQVAANPYQQMLTTIQKFPHLARIHAVYRVRQAVGLEARDYYGAPAAWAPDDFGQARMAAMGWLFNFAQREGKDDALVAGLRDAADRGAQDPRPAWNWLYLELVRGSEDRRPYEAARVLARVAKGDPTAQWYYLYSLNNRAILPGKYNYRMTQVGVVDRTPPLSADEVDRVLAAYETVRRLKPDWIRPEILANVDAELKRAKRAEDRERFYRGALASANDAPTVASLLELAAERGDVDSVLTLFDQGQAMHGLASYSSFGWYAGPVDPLGRAMNARAESKAHADLARILDHYLAILRRRDPSARRSRSGNYLNAGAGGRAPFYVVWVGKDYRYTTLDFPTPNDYYDHDAIQLLRTAYELDRRDGKLDDLFAHLGRAAESGTEVERVYGRLGLCYLHWWKDERDEAIRELDEAAKILPADPELRLARAELLERRGDLAGALAAADAVEPTDQRMMQRRELMALRLAVGTGGVDHARKAAERLFGLRLDSDVQLQLAGQMSQLAMHELAESVLARVRRRAGNKGSALVALMHQYLQQNKSDVAVQVAHQILRRLPQQGNTINAYQEDSARREAIQTLARSGKLKEMISRLEAQVASSPTSFPLWKTLAEYYRADGQATKAREASETVARLRPDDARLRMQIGVELVEASEPAAAVVHFRDAIKADPSQYRHQYPTVQSAFQQAGKLDELVALLNEIDIRPMGYPYPVTYLVQALLKEDNRRDQALALFRKAWKAFSNDRIYLFNYVDHEAVWRMPEMYGYLREAVLPQADQPLPSPWTGADDFISYDTDGRPVGLISRLVQVAIRQNSVEPLLREVEAALKASPDWSTGRGLRGVLLARLGRYDEARRDVQALLDDTSNPVPSIALRLLARELEDFGPIRDLGIELYRRAVKEADADQRWFIDYHPARQLAAVYRRNGRAREARDLLLEAGAIRVTRFADDWLNRYYQVANLESVGGLLLGYGFAADAARAYDRILGDDEGFKAYKSYLVRAGSTSTESSVNRKFQKRLDQSLDRARRPADPTAPFALLPPGDGGGKVDLALIAQPRELERAALRCLFEDEVCSASPEARAEVRARLRAMHEQAPDDLSIRVALALVALAEGREQDVAEAVKDLAARVPATPLPAASSPDARPPAALEVQSALWAVARACSGRDALREPAEVLAARALEAADRLADPAWSLAMLRERGQLALDRGDRDGAERAWSDLLRRVLTPRGQPATSAGSGVPVATPDRFNQAARVARLAARHGFDDLSLRAIREALRGGPPVQPLANTSNRRPLPASTAPQPSAANEVAARVLDLEALWHRPDAPAGRIYEALREVVLPDARPEEAFLYPRPLAPGDATRPSSVGALLVAWAGRAGRADDLRQRAEARRSKAMAEVPGLVLLGQLALAAGDDARANEALAALGAGLGKDTSQTSAELACHVAFPALGRPGTAKAALLVADLAVKGLAGGTGDEPLATLNRTLARHHFAGGQLDEGRKRLKQAQEALDRAVAAGTGDESLARRKRNLQVVAREYLRAGLWADALDTLGLLADAPSAVSGDPPLGDVAASFRRQFLARPARERFERLRAWTLPTPERNSVRLLAAFVPEDAPPESFGSFHPPTGGVVSTASLLIDAARELGRLDALAEEARKLAEAKVENARTLSVLIELARGRGESVASALEEIQAALPAKIPGDDRVARSSLAWSDYLIARACLADPTLATRGQAMAGPLSEHALKVQDAAFLSHLRRDAAASRLGLTGGPPTPSTPGLELWEAATQVTGSHHARGPVPPWWAEDQGHLIHVAGAGDDGLVFAYPLSGSFEVSVDAYFGAGQAGRIGFGGLVFEPLPTPDRSREDPFAVRNGQAVRKPEPASQVRTLGGRETLPRECPALRPEAFNRLSLRVESGKLRALVNGHLFHEADLSSTSSPWLTLSAAGDRQATFRNLSITGTPTIPRQVRLVASDRLDGWVAGFYGETQPPRLDGADPIPDPDADPSRPAPMPSGDPDDFDWLARGGEILGRRNDPPASSSIVPSRLAYHRPLRDGESLSYEFFHEPGSFAVHPALDRLVFLLEPEGIRLRWMTDGPDLEWTGLGPDNAVDEPARRRGPGRLPLKSGDWNRLRLSLKGRVATLELNGVVVYERPLELSNDRQFSLYHDKDRTSARVRDVVLTGPWPESLSPDRLTDLAGRREAEAVGREPGD